MQQQQPSYPQWYRSLRAFLLGTVFGVLVLNCLQQFNVVPAPLPAFPSSLVLVFTQLLVLLVLALFEIGFGVARHRRLRREMERRPAAA